MLPEKKPHPEEKTELHPRNKHRKRYDFPALVAACPALSPFVHVNEFGDESINFFDPEAVKVLNKALLKHFYKIDEWDVPPGYLCPPIPGRADYIHHIADLLATSNNGKIPTGEQIKVLDIGVGANCVYPIIGHMEYGWTFTGTDIDWTAIDSAKKIVELNTALQGHIDIRYQYNPKEFFNGILRKDECIDLVICNPPFHSSLEEAQTGTIRKLRNLHHKKNVSPVLNFGGQNNELWTKGGEARFIKDMVWESRRYSDCSLWFSALISKEANLKTVYQALEKVEAKEVKTINMGQGNKRSRVVAWSFFDGKDRLKWGEEYWK